MVGSFDDLIKRLNKLKEDAKYWVYQDTIDARKLIRYAKTLNYGLSMLKSSEASKEADFPGIITKNFRLFGIIPAIYIFNKDKPRPDRALVLAHGVVTSKKESLITLGKRLASQDYLVCCIDLSSHGESRDQFRLGLITENILMAVRWFRSQGISKVGVIGHSLGAICTLFALCGYNQKVEIQFYKTSIELQKKIAKINKELDKTKDEKYTEKTKEEIRYDLISSIKEYTELKQIILDGLKNMYQSNSRIDAAVLLAAPRKCQMFLPPEISFFVKQLHNWAGGVAGRAVTQAAINKLKKRGVEDILLPKLINEKGYAQLMNIVTLDVYDLFDYAQKVKNPYDYMEAIDKLCDNTIKPDRIMGFIKYYKQLIIKTPKLYIYGLADKILLKGVWKGMLPMFLTKGNYMLELEKHYKNFGQNGIERVPGVDHSLNTEARERPAIGTLPKLTYKIVTFLNQYLGKGRLV